MLTLGKNLQEKIASNLVNYCAAFGCSVTHGDGVWLFKFSEDEQLRKLS